MWFHNEIENKQRFDYQQLQSESTGEIKADLVLKVCASLMRDVFPLRVINSANEQDLVQEFLDWSEKFTVEFVTKKPSFPSWHLIRLHYHYLCDVPWKLENVTARRTIVWTIKGIWSPKRSTLFSSPTKGSQKAFLARMTIIHLLFRRRQRTLPFL